MTDPHWLLVARDVEAHPGTTHLEVTIRLGIPSPHRRVAEAKAHGWRFTATKQGEMWRHYAYPPGSTEGGAVNGKPTVEIRMPEPPPPAGIPSHGPSVEAPALTAEEEERAREWAEANGFRIPVDRPAGAA